MHVVRMKTRLDYTLHLLGYPELAALLETGLMWANMLRAFHVGKALTRTGEPSSRMRFSRVACAQLSWPACHLTKASASAVM